MNVQMLMPILAVAAILLCIFIMMGLLAKNYKKAGPNEALIVSGRQYRLPDGTTVGFRIVKGGGTFVFPIIEKAEVVPLQLFSFDFKFPQVRLSQTAAFRVNGSVQAKVATDYLSIALAAERFLKNPEAEMKTAVLQTLEKEFQNALQSVGEAKQQELDAKRPQVVALVEEAARQRLKSMGLELANLCVREMERV